jgi:DNA helicase-2/ATP-dependent DNA helicase PcrA
MPDLNSLNEAQLEAVTHIASKDLLIVAGPGSGKTFVITQRILYLIREMHIPPESILVVTFTKDAALSMQNRFLELSDCFYPVNFGTFHSIFYNILRQSIPNTKLNIMSDRQKKNILNKIPADIQSESLTAQLISSFSFYKNTDDRTKAKAKLTPEYADLFDVCFEEYEKARKRKKLIDFDDMVYDCYCLLSSDPNLLKKWQDRFRYILIDEFQDINPVQMSAVNLLKGENCHIFAVGDDDQSIYGFRGALPECMLDFKRRYDAKAIYLSLNYRSTADIVNASLKVISENKNRFVKELMASTTKEMPPDTVKIRKFINRDEEYENIINELRNEYTDKFTNEHIDKFSGESTAVLFRTHILMQGFASYLTAADIPFVMKEKPVSIYEHFIVKDVFSYLELSMCPDKRECLLRILNRPVRYINREAVMAQGTDIWCAMRNYYIKNINIPYRAERLNAVEKLKKDIERMGKMTLYLAVKYILKSIGYEKMLTDNKEIAVNMAKKQEIEEVIEWLCTESKKYGSFSEWNIERQVYEESLRKSEKNDRGNECALHLMTVHASKGLEFDRVIIPDCNENVYPHGRMTDKDICEEERRIFYVAMTRARKKLELMYITGTKTSPRLPSRFLNPLLFF